MESKPASQNQTIIGNENALIMLGNFTYRQDLHSPSAAFKRLIDWAAPSKSHPRVKSA
jgi:hypothetical protein